MGARFKPSVDLLEDRAVPATITVTSLADNLDADGQITLREAIQAANTDTSVDGSTTGAGADVIQFDAGIAGGVIDLTLIGGTNFGPNAFEITSQIAIDGSGETIRRAATAANMRLFFVSMNGNLSLDHLTLSNGAAVGGNGGSSFGNAGGGGGGGLGAGGAIFNAGTLNITASTLTGNTAQGGNGGDGQGLGVTDAGGGAGGGGMGGNGGSVLDVDSDGGAGGGGTFGNGGDSDSASGRDGGGGGGTQTNGEN
jgi:CSLREA domain-containing protein